jgi:hypothetical protein
MAHRALILLLVIVIAILFIAAITALLDHAYGILFVAILEISCFSAILYVLRKNKTTLRKKNTSV